MSQPTRPGRARKAPARPKRPYPDFPLTPHPSGKWCKKIRGQLHYFGQWARRLEGVLIPVDGDGWEDALAEYKKVADDLHAGRTPRADPNALTVGTLCNHFLTAKLRKVDAGELTSSLFYDYKVMTDFLVKHFSANRLVEDLAAGDFEKLREAMARKWGPVRLANSITRVKSVFKYGYEAGLMERPVRYGPEFKKPSATVLRKHKATQPAKMLEAEEVRALIDGKTVEAEGGPRLVKPTPQLRALILLGINCGFGNADCAELPTSAVDLEAGWINFPRPKTGIGRRCSLWPETVEAIKAAVMDRPKPAQSRDVGRVFLSESGTMLVTRSEKGHTKDLIGYHFTNLLKATGLYRRQIGFYTLRHCFETVAGETADQVAVDVVMGHGDNSMAANYREGVSDERLRAVANKVREWLWPRDHSAAGYP
jgi:integrase